MSICVAESAGFCFGVNRAVNILYDMVEKGEKVCTLGPIIHNPQLVADIFPNSDPAPFYYTFRHGPVAFVVFDVSGYDMIGIDSSDMMLDIATKKEGSEKILYLNQDMCEFELYGTVDFIVSSLDCINYITDKRDLLKVMKLANNYLNPKGLFIFDINTRHKLENVIGDNTFVLEDEGAFCVWQNEYDKKKKIADFYLTFFMKEGEEYVRFDEEHSERAYEIEEIKEIIEKSGMKLLKVYHDQSFKNPAKNSERVFFVVQEQGKNV